MAEALGVAGSIIAVIEITAKIGIMCSCYLSDARNAAQDINRVSQKTSDLQAVLHHLLQKCPRDIDPSRIEQCSNDIAALQERIDPDKKQRARKSVGFRELKWPLQKAQVEKEINMLEGHLKFFGMITNLEIRDTVDDAERSRQLDKLAFIGDAVFDSYENNRHCQCLENTRVDVLQKINTWASNGSRQPIFWLKGMAGTGKSTIALTTAHNLDGPPSCIIASYFFKRGGGDLASSRKLLTTLVRQMANKSPAFCNSLLPAIRDKLTLGQSASMKDQFDKLLIGPLRNLKAPKHNFVWVIDALDECDKISEIRLFLRLIAQTPDIQNLPLRVFVTSRPEISNQGGFGAMPQILHYDLVLHKVSRDVVDTDITKFFEHEMEKIRADRHLPDDWPSLHDIQRLVSRAAGLFIFASTACRYIDCPPGADPQERLQTVCNITSGDEVLNGKLDQMYKLALEDSFKSKPYTKREIEKICRRFRRVIGSIILLHDPLPISGLRELLGAQEIGSLDDIEETLTPLQAIIDVPPEIQHPVRILHLSFRDFLLDTERCTDLHFWINEEEAHNQLFLDCIKLMSRSLDRDLCSLCPGTLHDEISRECIDQKLFPALKYACRYWANHVRSKHVENGRHVFEFFKAHALHWLMVMSAMSRITEAIQIITELKTKLAGQGDVSGFLWDFQRFVLNFRHVIGTAPYQVYISALIFCPRKSITRNAFSVEAPQWVMIKGNEREEWNACRSTLEGHSGLISKVVFSPDGHTVASGSYDNTVRLWDTQTGECRSTLEGHSGLISKVVFSPDGQTVTSGSYDNTVRLWDTQTGECRSIFEGHSGLISKVVFSPDGQTVASGSRDKTVRLWDTQTGECRSTLEGHSESISTVVFSPDGHTVASGSLDKTVRLWDTQTGECRSTLEGHSESISTVVFSPDGQTVASGSRDKTVRLWDTQTGECRSTLEGHSESISTVVFSPDGQTVASGSRDKTVRLWDTQTGESLIRHKARSIRPEIAFSPECNILIIDGATLQFTPPVNQPDRLLRKDTSDDGETNFSINLDNQQEWVLISTKRILWIPHEYRTRTYAIDGNKLVLVAVPGSVIILHFDLQHPDLKSYITA